MLEWILSSCILIAAVALIRLIFKGKIPARLQYALWGLVLLRLLVPVNFFQSRVNAENLVVFIEKQPGVQSAVSALNTPIISADQALQQAKEELEQADTEESSEVALVQRQQAIMEHSSPAFVLETTAYALWFAGITVTALCFLLSNIRFARHLGKHRRPLEGTGSACRVYICEGLDTPCLLGLIHPAIYLTPGEAADGVRMGHIIAHETTHLRHFDHIWSALRCVCLVLHWYNPLVWLAAGLSRRDCELACDEATIQRIGEDQRISYGTTLIEMTCTKSSATGLLDIATTMTGSKTALKERVKMIAKKPKTVLYALIAALLIAAITAGCAFSGGSQSTAPSTSVPTEPPVTTEPKPAETNPPTTEPENTTQPAEMQEFLPIRPIPDVYNISVRWPEWDMSKLYSEEMKDYNPWVYPIWQDNASRSDWVMLILQSEALPLISNGKEENMTDELLGKLAWLEVEWEYLNQKPMEKSFFPYLELDREDYLNVLPAGNVEIDSPYVMPEAYDVQIQDPLWFDSPHNLNDAVTAEVYPYWECIEYRIEWIESLLHNFRVGGWELEEGELEKIAWLEAQLQHLGGQLQESVFSTLNIDPADYLTAK